MKRSISFLVGFGVIVCAAFAISAVAGTSPGSTDRSIQAGSTMSRLDVFDRARVPTDVAPAGLVDALDGIEGTASIPTALRPGSLELSQSRRLAARLGELGADMFVFPTSKGRVCMALYVEHRGGPQTCVSGMDAPVTWSLFDYDGTGRGTPTGVFGLMSPDVVGVNVVVAGKAASATIENGAYFFEADRSRVPEAVIAILKGGQRSYVRLPRPRD